ncbi:MAG TPA: hypothetical protein VMF65_23020 [Acidimicrobiales bacterium]|nr:hypothetical protein [Acidimicrobiales bacterium]
MEVTSEEVSLADQPAPLFPEEGIEGLLVSTVAHARLASCLPPEYVHSRKGQMVAAPGGFLAARQPGGKALEAGFLPMLRRGPASRY